ncbi:hypothetical protein M407DRAFT_148727 [Tulasnella calospora MUT 4182]|uniref:ZZ-type domain-containing protein n=1 Tax=Tulasnella calospora MUT 4182 TaxID=1051891 RepID=A0A0C3PWA9_9AGAM|nr:hypothetical protein M407DRAFT_148727 [Tulasnella calospora MUT 4182]
MENNIPEVDRNSSPMSGELATLVEQKCNLCENIQTNQRYVECTVCQDGDGSTFLLCLACVDDRAACIAHQANLGSHHLFRRLVPPGTIHFCNHCHRTTMGDWSLTCLVCPSRDGYDMCRSCCLNPSAPRHAHRLAQVSPRYIIQQPHMDYLPPSTKYGVRSGFACDGVWCPDDMEGLFFHCTVCPRPGYDLCPACADSQRQTYLHEIQRGNRTHRFVVYDARPSLPQLSNAGQ